MAIAAGAAPEAKVAHACVTAPAGVILLTVWLNVFADFFQLFQKQFCLRNERFIRIFQYIL